MYLFKRIFGYAERRPRYNAHYYNKKKKKSSDVNVRKTTQYAFAQLLRLKADGHDLLDSEKLCKRYTVETFVFRIADGMERM